MNTKFLIIGDEKGKRIEVFLNCLKNKSFYNYNVLTWQEIINNQGEIKKYLENGTIVKIEPPEKDLYLYKSFLKIGLKENNLDERKIDNIDFSKCPIIDPSNWYKGIEKVFLDIDFQIKNSEHRNIFMMNDINESLIMMDKKRTYDMLEKSSYMNKEFYLPKRLKSYKNYNEFREEVENKYIKCFIKLRCGSGSEGVIAYSNNPRFNEEKIHTSLNYSKEENIFYSGYKVNSTTEKDIIKKLINWVFENGAHVETWIPKDRYNGLAFDTRSIVIDKKSEYLLGRLSKTPITNLHLKNERKESIEYLNEEKLNTIKTASEAVMNVFNNSFLAGIDVVNSRNGKPYIIDVNPFGDLLHHLIGTNKNIYYKEIDKSVKKIKLMGES